MKIYFQNFRFCPILKSKINKIYGSALSYFGLDFKNFLVNLKLVAPAEIQRLNQEFRQKNTPTDVLSFPNLEIQKAQGLTSKMLAQNLDENGFVLLGDIAICTNIAKAQAKEYGHSLKREMCFLALHGLLHLLGFDHMTKEDETEMMALAEEILEKNKVGRNV